jgi:hypothetical protein
LKLEPFFDPVESRGRASRKAVRYCPFSGLPQSFEPWPGAAPGQAANRGVGRATDHFLGGKLKNAKCNSLLLNI